MEMKTYRRYTKNIKKDDIRHVYDIEVCELSGKVTRFDSYKGLFSVKIMKQHYYFLKDDVMAKALKESDVGDVITFKYWKNRYIDKREVISVINHTKNFQVINQKLMSIFEYQERKKTNQKKD